MKELFTIDVNLLMDIELKPLIDERKEACCRYHISLKRNNLSSRKAWKIT
ncbi:hypothetical protein [Yeosuana marina]|nr:hypothetical protein [Yeosuana marina]